MTTDYKITEIFCATDEFSKKCFVELESRVFFKMMFFLNLHSFGRCTGITFVDSTMIPVCHNLRRYAKKVFIIILLCLSSCACRGGMSGSRRVRFRRRAPAVHPRAAAGT